MSIFGLVCYFLSITVVPDTGVFHLNPPPLFLHPILVRFCCRRRHLPCPFQFNYHLFPLVPTTASPPVTPAPSLTHHIGSEVIVLQYNARPYSAFAECRFPLSQTPPLLFPPHPRCTTNFRPASAVEAAPSVSTPLGIGNPPRPVPCGG